MSATVVPTGDVFAELEVVQPGVAAELRAATRAPVHAYLLTGSPGAGSATAARAFSAALLCPEGGCGHCRTCRLALAGDHPDALTFSPTGAALSVRDEVPEIVRLAARSPVEGARKVLILTDFHRVQQAGPALLKTIEEPPASTVFVILADTVPPELVTIASRCVTIEVPPLTDAAVEGALVATGVDAEGAARVARAAMGDLTRARVLLTDERLVARQEAWWSVPTRLDGTGAAVAALVAELLELIGEAAGPLEARQRDEVAELEEQVERYGERGSGRSKLGDRHKRELRRHRTDELRFGLGVLAGRYREALSTVPGAGDAITTIHAAAESLVRNPNETLLLQALLLRLPPLPG